MVLGDTIDKDFGIAIHVYTLTVWLLKMDVVKVKHLNCVRFPLCATWYMKTVKDFKRFALWELKLLGPNSSWYVHRLNPSSSTACMLVLGATSVRVEVKAAKRAFIGINEDMLTKLLVSEGGDEIAEKQCIKLHGVMTYVEVLTRFYLACSEEDLAHILAQRATAKNNEVGLDMDNIGLTDEVLDISDKKEIVAGMDENEHVTQNLKNAADYIRKRPFGKFVAAKIVGGPSKPVSPAPDSGKPSGSADKATPGPKAVVIRIPDLKIELVRKRLPQVKGCILQPYEHLFHFRQYYSEATEAPRSRHIKYGESAPEGMDKPMALACCLMWAWRKHQIHTGEECPFGFPPEVEKWRGFICK